MSRSFLAGAATGLVLSVLGFGVLSLMVAPPVAVPPTVTAEGAAAAPAAPATETATAEGGEAAEAPQPGTEAEAPAVPPAAPAPSAEPAPAPAPAIVTADQGSAPPAEAAVQPAPAAPGAGEAAPAAVAPAAPAPAQAPVASVDAPAPQAAPAAPEGPAALPAADQPPPAAPAPATAPAPADTATAETAPAPVTTTAPAPATAPAAPARAAPAPAPDAPPPAAPAPDAGAEVGRVVSQPSAGGPDSTLSVAAGAGTPVPEGAQPPAAAATPETATQPDAAPDAKPTIIAPPGGGTLTVRDAPANGPLVIRPGNPATAATDLPKVVTLVPPSGGAGGPEAAAPAPGAAGTDQPASSGEGGARVVPGVKILRLPGMAEAPAPDAGPDKGAQSQAEAGPLRRYAAAFTNPDNKPLLGVLIFDLGVEAGGLDPAALASLPFPVTIAVDPSRPDASAVAASYHAAGAEVAILAGSLPDGSTPSDIEVAYQGFTATLPDSVALVGRPGSTMLQGGRTAEHVAALLAADGRGLITYDAGLNDGRRAAEKAGLPNAVIEKLLDRKDDNEGTVRRELDRAAFMAAQKGETVVALPSTPEAVTSLVAWATGPQAKSVAVAPVSAVMMKGR